MLRLGDIRRQTGRKSKYPPIVNRITIIPFRFLDGTFFGSCGKTVSWNLGKYIYYVHAQIIQARNSSESPTSRPEPWNHGPAIYELKRKTLAAGVVEVHSST